MPNGLNLYVKRDGTWLEFVASTGRRSAIRIESLAQEQAKKVDGKNCGIIAKTLDEWCKDRQAESQEVEPEPFPADSWDETGSAPPESY